MALNENVEAILSKANEVAQSAAKKAKGMASVAKAKVAILTEEDKIKKAQVELGKLYYRDFSEGSDPDLQEYLPWCEKITASKQTIEELKQSIEDQKAAPEAENVVTAEDPDLSEIEVEVVPEEPQSGENPEQPDENA